MARKIEAVGGDLRRADSFRPSMQNLKWGPRTAEAGWGEADVLYGVTMQEQGISRMLTINLNDVEKELRIK